MSAPKIDSDEELHLVGDVSNPSTIMSWHCDALLASVSHGEFYVWKRHVMFSGDAHFTFSVYGGLIKGTYNLFGAIGPPTYEPADVLTQAPPLKTQMDRLQDDYPTAYKRMRPGNPQASLGQFVAELRDLPQMPLKQLLKARGRRITTHVPLRSLPRVLRERHEWFRALGSEYLNVQFGWKPFVSDLQKMYNLWVNLDKEVAKLRSQAGKSTFKATTVSSQTKTEGGAFVGSLQEIPGNVSTPGVSPPSLAYTVGLPFWGVYGAPPNFGWTGSSQLSVVRTTNERVWATSHWRSFIHDSSPSQWSRRAKLMLFGALPTPELLWEIMPYSWLIDWFSNVGDVMSNVSPNAADHQVLDSSYIMRSWIQKTTYSVFTHVDPPPSDGSAYWSSGSYSFHATDETTIKTRAGGGNPYGIRVKLESLSSYQLSILAALGISRSKVK